MHVGLFLIEAKKLKKGKPRKTCKDGVCLKNHGQSGKFSISRGDKDEDDAKTVTIEFVSIKEVDAAGNVVANTGPKSGKHSYKTFASLDFDFTDLINASYKVDN
jgi:hypothetical protein